MGSKKISKSLKTAILRLKKKPFYSLLGLIAILLLIGAVYVNSSKTQISNVEEIINSPSETPLTSPTVSPKPKTPSPKPTTTPTSQPTSNLSSATCGINFLTDSSSDLAVKLAYSVSSSNGTYMSAAQWDFDGNGTWDTDLSINNGTIVHTYPASGTYSPRLQLKMSDGKMTNVCQGSVTVPFGISVTLSGQVYSDTNCNNSKEEGESGISNVTINIFKNPEFYIYETVYSDSNGNYSLTKTISVGDILSITPGDIAAAGYKIFFTRSATTLSNALRTAIINLAQVPNANIGQCPI